MNNTMFVALKPGDFIRFQGTKYRVLKIGDRSIDPPLVGFALWRFLQDITLLISVNSFEDYQVNSSFTSVNFKGIVRFIPLEQLDISSMEQRSFKRIIIKTFTIKGWMEYHCIEEYEDT
jgi:hypothetical protein